MPAMPAAEAVKPQRSFWIAVICGAVILTIGIGARMAQPTPELQAAEVETVRKWIDVAQRLGAGHVRDVGRGHERLPRPQASQPVGGGTGLLRLGWCAPSDRDGRAHPRVT